VAQEIIMPDTSTHQFVDIEDIKDGVIVLRNKNLRSVLMVSSINFDLKSSDEKKALISSFQRFLNSLDFTAQIVIHSRPLDLTDYFGFLKEQQEKQESELFKIQTSEYIDFVQELVTLSNIMSTFFYVVVSYNIAVIKKIGIIERFLPKEKKEEDTKESPAKEEKTDVRFEEAREKLRLRTERIVDLLGEMGLRAIPLKDREIIELFYGLYNPGVALKQKNLELLLATGEEAKQTE